MSINYEMGYTQKEFESVLKGGFCSTGSGFNVKKTGDDNWQVSIPEHNITITITTTNRPPRILGAFSLPVLQVSFEVTPDNNENRQQFFKRFHQYFHKGGG